jgi:hypothetical protein
MGALCQRAQRVASESMFRLPKESLSRRFCLKGFQRVAL